MRVIVIGAGASCSYIESPTGARPPLAREIFPTFHRLDISANRYVLVGNIINYIRDTRGISPEEFSYWNEDLEAVLSEIDEISYSLANKHSREERTEDEFYMFMLSTNAYQQLIFLFASIFNEIQNGPISIPYLLLSDELAEEDTIITFNWDTLMDRALLSSGKWHFKNGYGITPEHVYEDRWIPQEELPTNKSNIQYLKLHGSTNWLTPYQGVHLTTGQNFTLSGYAMDKLYVFHKASAPYETYERRYWGPYEPFSYCYYPPNLPLESDYPTEEGMQTTRIVNAVDLPEHGSVSVDEKEVFSMPLIIPPVRNKQYSRYGAIFSKLWTSAEEEISKCAELYLIGYSFPVTDIASRVLFSVALRRNQSLEKIVIINPTPEPIHQMLIDEFHVEGEKIEIRKQAFDVPLSGKDSILG